MIEITINKNADTDDLFGSKFIVKYGRQRIHCEDLDHALRRVASVVAKINPEKEEVKDAPV